MSSSWLCQTNTTNKRASGRRSKKKTADEMLVHEMNELTVQERQRVYEDVHGVLQEEEETCQSLEEGISKMKTLLKEASKKRRGPKSGFSKALFFVPNRVYEEPLLLQFLRCEDYNAIKAVQRLIRFFDFMFDYFGIDGILKPGLTIDDLEPDDVDFLKTGAMQPLPASDQSGRPVVMFFDAHLRFKHVRSLIRSVAYVYLSVLQNPVAQQKGVVVVSWATERETDFAPPVTPSLIRASMTFCNAAPLKIAALHYCYDNALYLPVMELAKLAIGQRGRVRFRPWFGSGTECKYNLMSFGMHVASFPLEPETGRVLTKDFLEWLASRQAAERTTTNAAVVIPTSRDILLGRGQPFRSFPGNLYLSQLVQERWAAFDAEPRFQKRVFLEEVAKELQAGGIRVLRRSQDGWEVATEAEMITKVGHAFRNKPVVDKYHRQKDSFGLAC